MNSAVAVTSMRPHIESAATMGRSHQDSGIFTLSIRLRLVGGHAGVSALAASLQQPAPFSTPAISSSTAPAGPHCGTTLFALGAARARVGWSERSDAQLRGLCFLTICARNCVVRPFAWDFRKSYLH